MRIIECFSLVCCQFSGQEYRGAHMWGSREKAQQFFGRKMSWLLIKTTTTLFSHVSRGRWRQRQLATSLPSFLLLCLQTRESSSRRNFPFSKCSLKIHGKERTFWFHFFFALWVYRTFFQGHHASCIEEEEHHNESCLQKSSLLRLLCTVNAWIKERSSWPNGPNNLRIHHPVGFFIV